MIWLTLLLLAFCALIAWAPGEAAQIMLATLWASMAAAAVVLPVLALFRLI